MKRYRKVDTMILGIGIIMACSGAFGIVWQIIVGLSAALLLVLTLLIFGILFITIGLGYIDYDKKEI
jgi:hypothetical protein